MASTFDTLTSMSNLLGGYSSSLSSNSATTAQISAMDFETMWHQQMAYLQQLNTGMAGQWQQRPAPKPVERLPFTTKPEVPF